MPTGLPRYAALALLCCGSPLFAADAINPLAGDTQAAQERSVGPVAAPALARGKLLADPASGGVVFTDEEGWYRFTMADGGTTQLEGAMRIFQFKSGGQDAVCFAVRTVNDAFAKFSMDQIQAELDTLYAPFDPAVEQSGATILHRESIPLNAQGQVSAVPLKVLAWDTRDDEGTLVTYTVAPLPVGQLTFACGVGSAGHAREIIQRYLRIAEGGLVPAT
jgi:hypothetical protein